MYIPPLLDELKLEAQASFFKVTMLANFATTHLDLMVWMYAQSFYIM
jgi:hypothetical protein